MSFNHAFAIRRPRVKVVIVVFCHTDTVGLGIGMLFFSFFLFLCKPRTSLWGVYSFLFFPNTERARDQKIIIIKIIIIIIMDEQTNGTRVVSRHNIYIPSSIASPFSPFPIYLYPKYS